MPRLVRMLVVTLAACAACLPSMASSASAAEGAPLGAWRATNDCFLAAFVLTADGRVQAAYLSGERDEMAAWTWDGTTLKITSNTFDMDRFTGRLALDRLEAAYAWPA